MTLSTRTVRQLSVSEPEEVLPFVPVPFMTVIPGRSPETKMHKRLTDAKNAFSTQKMNAFEIPGSPHSPRSTTHSWGKLYEFKGGEWVLLYEVPKPDDTHAIPEYPYRESRPWKLNG